MRRESGATARVYWLRPRPSNRNGTLLREFDDRVRRAAAGEVGGNRDLAPAVTARRADREERSSERGRDADRRQQLDRRRRGGAAARRAGAIEPAGRGPT